MVTIHALGGCANQLFVYAAGLALSKRLGVGLQIDNCRYDNPNEWRVYSLGLFAGINEPVVKGQHGVAIRETSLPYNHQLFESATRDCTLYGYFQTEKYFAECREELIARIRPREPIPRDSHEMFCRIIDEGHRSVFLTIRRTDYVTTPFHGVLPMDYYEQAAEVIASRVPDPCFFVFSDEMEWCEQNFKLRYRTVIAGNFHRTVKPHLGREDAELWLMSNCNHAILANSSYSWWGAWLGKSNYGGIVVAPQNWFGPTADADARDICPDRWIKV